jgi:hypothetical protein
MRNADYPIADCGLRIAGFEVTALCADGIGPEARRYTLQLNCEL